MTKQDQKRFVRSLTRAIATDLIARIDANKVPVTWDGHELREWLYEKFQFERTRLMAGPGPRRSRRRYQAFRNDCYTNNL
jgi:hypothetical protein